MNANNREFKLYSVSADDLFSSPLERKKIPEPSTGGEGSGHWGAMSGHLLLQSRDGLVGRQLSPLPEMQKATGEVGATC